MGKCIFFSLLFFLSYNCPSIAQLPQLPKQVKVGKPEILKPKSGTYKRDDLEKEFQPGSKWGTKKTVPEFWVVRSDRNRNPVYADTLKTRILTTMLAFNQPVVICEVKGDMALVYEDNKMEKYPEIPSYAKPIGWVPMENLLLWDACPTDQRGVRYKAVIAINLNKLNGGKSFKGVYYKDPERNEDPHHLAMGMKFYFIMKESANGQRVLLCENPTVFGNNLYGWVDDNAFTRWNQRVCLEPNWDLQFVESHKGQEVGVYADKNLSSGNKVTSWEYGKSNGDKDQWFQYRMDPSQLRFPIIEKVDEHTNTIHCIFIDHFGKANFGEENIAFLKHNLGEAGFERWKQIEGVLLFDGYVPAKDKEGNDYWHYVALFSGDELQQLLADLKPAYKFAAGKMSDDRKPYIDAMKELVKVHLGQTKNEEIDNMDENLLKNLIYGFDVHTDLGNRKKLKDIANPQAVSDIEYQKMLSNFKDNYEKLLKSFTDGYTYRTKFGKDWYYWIPIEDLP